MEVKSEIKAVIGTKPGELEEIVTKAGLKFTGKNLIYVLGVGVKKKYGPQEVPKALDEAMAALNEMSGSLGISNCETWRDVYKIVHHEGKIYLVVDIEAIPAMAMAVIQLNDFFDSANRNSIDMLIHATSSMSLKSVIEMVISS